MGSGSTTITKYDIEFDVDYYFDKGRAGTHWEPPELPELYIEVVRIGGVDVTELLDSSVIEKLNDELAEHLSRNDDE